MNSVPSARLDLPLQPGGEIDVSRLTLTFDSPAVARKATADLAELARKGDAVIVVIAVNSLDTSIAALVGLGQDHDNWIAGNGVGIATVSQAFQILELWRAEQHVLFVSPKDQVEGRLTRAEQNRPKWWQFASTARNELSFLTQVDGPVLIFSDSKAAIEIYSKDDPALLAIAAKARGVTPPRMAIG